MPDSLMYQEDHFVVLESNQPEKFLTKAELLEKLQTILSDANGSQKRLSTLNLPKDIEKFTTVEDRAKYLLDTSCDLDVGPGQFLQWYAIRLEK